MDLASLCGAAVGYALTSQLRRTACLSAKRTGRRGFDSRCHIKRGDIITQVSNRGSPLCRKNRPELDHNTRNPK